MQLNVKGKNLEVSDSIRATRSASWASSIKQLRRASRGRGRARGRTQPVDRGEPGRGGHGRMKGHTLARARGVDAT